MKRLLAVLLLLLTASGFAATVEIREWPVPWEDTRPRDPWVDAQGRVWFVGQTGDYLAYLQPRSGTFQRFELGKGAGPHNLIVDKKGQVWFAGNRQGYIGKLDPQSGSIKKYPMPDQAAGDPHTLIFGSQGEIWFTVQSGNFVGRLDAVSGKVELRKVETRGARPYGIVVDGKGCPWFNQFGTNRIGTIDPATMTIRDYVLPAERARTRRLVVGRDGGIWFVDYARGQIGRLDPQSGKVTEWETPGGARSLPYAMAIDDRGRLWFVETGPQPNRLVGFDPKTSRFVATQEIPSGGSTVRHMIFHQPTREIWFGTDKNTIGRAKLID
jgi:virginiamycin B lyase